MGVVENVNFGGEGKAPVKTGMVQAVKVLYSWDGVSPRKREF
jgi:hypothetical protein